MTTQQRKAPTLLKTFKAHPGLSSVHLVAHDFGDLVGQELLSRPVEKKLPFQITRFMMLNCGIVYSAYRPTSI